MDVTDASISRREHWSLRNKVCDNKLCFDDVRRNDWLFNWAENKTSTDIFRNFSFDDNANVVARMGFLDVLHVLVQTNCENLQFGLKASYNDVYINSKGK